LISATGKKRPGGVRVWAYCPARQSTAPSYRATGVVDREHADDPLTDRAAPFGHANSAPSPIARQGLVSAAQREHRRLPSGVVLRAGAVRVACASEQIVLVTRSTTIADHRPGRGVAEERDQERNAHESGVGERGDERAERGVAQVNAVAPGAAERDRDRRGDDRERREQIDAELHRVGEAAERQARPEAEQQARQGEEQHVGVQPRDRARRQPVQPRGDPAQQDQAEERNRHRQDGLHGGSIARPAPDGTHGHRGSTRGRVS
jgi:hypothetical protein